MMKKVKLRNKENRSQVVQSIFSFARNMLLSFLCKSCFFCFRKPLFSQKEKIEPKKYRTVPYWIYIKSSVGEKLKTLTENKATINFIIHKSKTICIIEMTTQEIVRCAFGFNKACIGRVSYVSKIMFKLMLT